MLAESLEINPFPNLTTPYHLGKGDFLPSSYTPKGGTLRATEVLDCPRKLAYHYHAQPRENVPQDPSFALKLREGNDQESLVLDTLYAAGAGLSNYQEQVSTIAGRVRIVGRIDALHAETQTVIEIKTLEDDGSLFGLSGPGKNHRAQVEVYMRGLGMPRASILYKSRATGQVRQFDLHADNALWREIIERLLPIAHSKSPEEIPRAMNPFCPRCPFKSRCWES